MLKCLALSLSLSSSALVPLPILDAHINAYQKQLPFTNITIADRLALTRQMGTDMRTRYRTLEDITEPEEAEA